MDTLQHIRERGVRMLEEVQTNTRSDLENMSQEQLREVIGHTESYVGHLRESLASVEAALAYDNIGWQPMGSDRAGDGTGIKLDALQRASETAQAMITANPLAKRGVEVRFSYIWGSGVQLGGVQRSMRSLRRTIATSEAQAELERTLASDGNLFFEVSNASTVRRVPLKEITGGCADPDDRGVLHYIKIKYTRWRSSSGQIQGTTVQGTNDEAEVVEEWVPTIELESPPVSAINGVKVNRDKRMKHVAVNRMVGWWWGIPDMYASSYWVSAYKKYLEQCAQLNEAHALFAWKAVAGNRKSGERMASTAAAKPSVDPTTGQPLNVGGMGVLGQGQDLAPLQHARSVDFDNGRPLAALVAAGLSIPLQVLTSDAGTGGSRSSDNALDSATRATMEARQQFLDDNLNDLAEMMGMGEFGIDWPDVGEEPLHRIVQALDTAGRTGMLYQDEWRKLLGRALRIKSDREQPPGEEDLPLVVQSGGSAPEAIEPVSYGDHELRDEGTQAHTDQA